MFEHYQRYFYISFVVLTNALAFTSLGGGLSWASPSMVKLLSPNSPIQVQKHEASWVGSFLAIGATVVAIPYTYLFNTVGRKWLITSTAASYLIGWLMLIFSTSVTHLYIGRFLIGTAVGPTFGIIPTYLAEVVSKKVRGSTVVILIISRSVGSLMQYSIGPRVSLQTLNIISTIVPAFLCVFSLMLPETPYYLLGAKREKEAEIVLMRLRGTNNPEEVKEEFLDIKNCLQESPKMPYKDLLKELSLTKTKKVIAIIAISIFGHQFCGVSAIIVYMETIFISMNSPIRPSLAVLITEILADITVLITLVIIDKVGRKPLLLVASLTCIAADVLIGLFFFLREKNILGDEHGWVGLIGMFLIHIGEAIGLASVPVVVMSEIMSFSLKGWLSGFYLVVQGTYNACSIKIFQILNDNVGSFYSYWMYAACILFSICYLMIFMPETKQKSLREIQKMLSKNDDDKESIELNSVTIKNNTNNSV